jgi:hypothetical protein
MNLAHRQFNNRTEMLKSTVTVALPAVWDSTQITFAIRKVSEKFLHWGKFHAGGG